MNLTRIFRGRRLTPLVAVVGLVAAGLSISGAQAAIPSDEDWKVVDHSVPNGTPVETGYQFKMINRTNGEMIVRKNQRWGIDLDFIPDPKNGFEGIKFERQAGPGALRYGDTIAIYVVNGGYLKYQSGHTLTVGLAYSSEPQFQWKFVGGSAGNVIRTGEAIGLVNIPRDSYLVWAFQPAGINLTYEKIDSGVKTASMSIAWRIGPFTTPGSGLNACSAVLDYRLSPVNLTGSTGTSTTVTFSRSFSQPTRTVGPNEYYCEYVTLYGGLRTGTWKAEVRHPLWPAQCTATLHAGTNTLNFTHGENGCLVNSIGFP